MRTRNETYRRQTNREDWNAFGISNRSNGRGILAAGLDLAKNVWATSWKMVEMPIQNLFNLTNQTHCDVTNLTVVLRQNASMIISKNITDATTLQNEKTELRERDMKAVISNISKYATICVLSLAVVFGQGTPKLDIQIEDQKVNLTKAEIEDPKVVVYLPGDTIRYVITASNIGSGLMTEPEIVDPVPAGVTYVAETASGDDTEITFSMNQGGTYMAWPPYYTVRNSKGILVKREATPDMISHIKWRIAKDLKPGETSTMEFLVVVDK